MGFFSILNDISGVVAQNHLSANSINIARTLNRLSSGKRINSGADDAAGLQIADSLRANIKALDQAVRNANDGIGVSQIADGALSAVNNLLIRSVTLAEQAATATVDSSSRVALDSEFTKITAEIGRIAAQTNFNGMRLFTTGGGNLAGTMQVFVGDVTTASSIGVNIGGLSTSSVGGVDFSSGVTLTTDVGAQSALVRIKSAIAGISSQRAGIGSGINRLLSAVSVLQSQSQNTQAAESTIRDANVAEEVANLTRYHILAQSGIAALTQANGSIHITLGLVQK